MMPNKEVITQSKIIANRHQCEHLIDAVLEYWENNPPTLGHGFAHILEVAVNGYEFAQKNQYPEPIELFIAGLYHDIYRPAEGKDGEDDQRKGAEISQEILRKHNVAEETVSKLYTALMSHDDWRGTEKVSDYELILSTADKASHNSKIVYGYSWASNKKLEKAFYSSHKQALYAFSKFQLRAWEIFMKHPIIGTEKAIEAYLEIYSDLTKNYLNDLENRHFFDLLDKVAATLRAEEEQTLKAFNQSDEKIQKITVLYH
jgi:HD superfamily phosphohydrolase YqeK